MKDNLNTTNTIDDMSVRSVEVARLREMVNRNELNYVWVQSKDNLADVMTKRTASSDVLHGETKTVFFAHLFMNASIYIYIYRYTLYIHIYIHTYERSFFLLRDCGHLKNRKNTFLPVTFANIYFPLKYFWIICVVWLL